MITTIGGILIRTRVADTRPIGRNTQGVRLIRVDEDDTVSSLAKLPQDEIGEAEAVVEAVTEGEPVDGAIAPEIEGNGQIHGPHLIDDGVADAEASDHPEDDGEAS